MDCQRTINFSAASQQQHLRGRLPLFDLLGKIKTEPNSFAINICLQGLYESGTVSEISDQMAILLKYHHNFFVINIDRSDSSSLYLKKQTTLDEIERLNSEGIYTKINGQRKRMFKSNMYKDLLYKSTLESQGTEAVLFKLTLFKTSQFVAGRSDIENLEQELGKIVSFLSRYFNYYSSTHSNSYSLKYLYLEFVGFADSNVQFPPSIDQNSQTGRAFFLDTNRNISLERAQRIYDWFRRNIDLQAIPCRFENPRACDDEDFKGTDRSVEIKAWIRDSY